MQLGLSESLPTLVARRFTAAKEGSHLIFSQTHLTTILAGGIPYQLRYCPALAKKPSATPKPKQDRGPKFDPFEKPSPELTIAQIPKGNPTHTLVLNKFPVIPNHFILATNTWKEQTDILEKEDLDAAYACVREWGAGSGSGSKSRRLFVFFNSGDDSGASQPHRHLQFLPIEDTKSGEEGGDWQPLIDMVEECSASSASVEEGYRRLKRLPFAHFALSLPANPSAEELHSIYMSLYRAALSTAKGGSVAKEHAAATAGPAAISYNLAMTESTMMICPRRSESARIAVDPTAAREVDEAGTIALNGTVLAGTLMVKAETEWDELRRNPEILTDVLSTIGYRPADFHEVSLL